MDFYLFFGIILGLSAIYLGFRNLRLGLLVLIALLPLNHKETLSFIFWNLTPPRVFLVGLILGRLGKLGNCRLSGDPTSSAGRLPRRHGKLRNWPAAEIKEIKKLEIKKLQEFCTFCHSEGSAGWRRPKNPTPKGFQPQEILRLAFGKAQNDGKNTKSAKLLKLEGLRRLGKDKFFTFLLLLWVIRAVSLTQSLNLAASFKLLAFFSAVAAFYLLFKSVYGKYGRGFLEQAKNLYLKIGLVAAVLGLIQLAFYYLTGKTVLGIWPVEGGIARPGSTFWDINHFAAYSASVALLFFGRYVQGPNFPESGKESDSSLCEESDSEEPDFFPSDSFWNFSAFLLMSLMVGLTASESGMMVLGVGFMTISFFLLTVPSCHSESPRVLGGAKNPYSHNEILRLPMDRDSQDDDKSKHYPYRRKFIPVAVLVLIGFLVVAGYFFKVGLGGLTNFREFYKINFTLENDSMASHFHLAEGALEIFNKYPLIGGGYGNFNEQFRRTSYIGSYLKRDPIGENRIPAHSVWLGALAETGLLGFLALVGVMFLPLVVTFGNVFRLFERSGGKESDSLRRKEPDSFLEEPRNDEGLGVRFVESVTFLGVILGLAVAGMVYSYNLLFFWFLVFLGLFSARDTLSKVAAVKFWPVFKSWVWRNREILAVGFLVAFSSIFIFWRLGRNALVPWDEGIYAGVSREMVARKDPLTLYWNRKTWFEKPPLFFWLQAFSFVYLDFKPFGARLPAALFGLMGVVLTYFFGKKLFSRRVGFFSAIILATTVHWVAWSRMAMLDVPAATLILASLYFFWQAYQNGSTLPKTAGLNPIGARYWLLFGTFLGLTFMTKGPVVMVPLAVAGSFVVLMGLIGQIGQRGRRLLRPLIITTIPFLLIVAPWHYLMIQRYGRPFIDEYFFYHMLKRASHGIEQHGRPFWWYNIVIRHWARYWYVFGAGSLMALGGSLVRKFREIKKLEIKKFVPDQSGTEISSLAGAGVFVFLWVVSTFLIFSFSKSKIQWYIMPVYPPLALVCGWFVKKLQDWFRIWDLGFEFSGSRGILTILVSFFLLVAGTGGLLLNRRMWFAENLNQQVAELSDTVRRLPGLEKKFYVADAPPPLPIFYSGKKVTTTDSNGLVAALYNPHVAILSKQGTYREVLRGLESGQLPPVIFAETEDYILYGR